MAMPNWAPVLGEGLADAVSGYQRAVLELPKLREQEEERAAKRELRPLATEAEKLELQQKIKSYQGEPWVVDAKKVGNYRFEKLSNGQTRMVLDPYSTEHPPTIVGGHYRYQDEQGQWHFKPVELNDPVKQNQQLAIQAAEELVDKPMAQWTPQDRIRKDVQQIFDTAGLGRSGIIQAPGEFIPRADAYGLPPAGAPGTPTVPPSATGTTATPAGPRPSTVTPPQAGPPQAYRPGRTPESATTNMPSEPMIQSYADFYKELGEPQATKELLNNKQGYPNAMTTLAREIAFLRTFSAAATPVTGSAQPTLPGVVPSVQTQRQIDIDADRRAEEKRKEERLKLEQERLRVSKTKAALAGYNRVKQYFDEMDAMESSARLAKDLEKVVTPGAVGWRGNIGRALNNLSQSMPGLPQKLRDDIYNPNIPKIKTLSAVLTYLHATAMKRMGGGSRGVTEGDRHAADELLNSLKNETDARSMIITTQELQRIIQGMRPFVEDDIKKGGFDPKTRRPLPNYPFPDETPASVDPNSLIENDK